MKLKRSAKITNLLVAVKDHVAAGRLTYSPHANQRLGERKVIKPEVEYVLNNGFHEAKKDEWSEEHQAWNYAIRGKTVDGRPLRISVSIVTRPGLLVVTVIDLTKEGSKK